MAQSIADALLEIAVEFRAAQFEAHAAHNLCKGEAFFADHAFLSEAYSAYEGAYDALIERLIGMGKKPDLKKVTQKAASKMETGGFERLLALEQQMCWDIEAACKLPGVTQGRMNLLAGLADDSEVRQYKIRQRMGC